MHFSFDFNEIETLILAPSLKCRHVFVYQDD